MSDKIIADFRRDGDLVALRRKSLGDQFFAESVAVSVGRIEKRDAKIESLVHQSDRFRLRKRPPPAG